MITTLIEPASLRGREATIEGEAYRHLFRARRLAVGDRLRVVDGVGGARWAEVAWVDRRTASLKLGAPAPTNEAAYQLDVLVAPLRTERASWLVEKATELGVAAVRFIATERTPRRFGEGTFDRLRRVACAAVEQSHRASVPQISGIHAWSELEALLRGRSDRFFLDPEADAGAVARPTGLAGALVIGPEGGFSPAEQAALARVATGIGLGPRILRAETAAVVAAGLLLR